MAGIRRRGATLLRRAVRTAGASGGAPGAPVSAPGPAVAAPTLSIEAFRRRFEAGELSLATWQEHSVTPDGVIPDDLDPHTPEYARAVAATWSAITGRHHYVSQEDETFDLSAGDYFTRPYPYSSGEPAEVARYFGAVAAMIERIGVAPPAHVVEYGSGWGHLALALASTGYRVTAVDINPASVELLRRRRDALGLGGDLDVVQAGFLDYEPAGSVDVVVFFESYHHCERPFELLDRCAASLTSNGRIVFLAEPFYDEYYAPWGVRLDGAAVLMAAQEGWLELGFRRDFFTDELVQRGFEVTWEVLPWLGDYGSVLVADRRVGDDPDRNEEGNGMVRLTDGSKRRLRRVVDRVMAPYVEQIADGFRRVDSPDATDPAPAPTPAGAGVPSELFHGVLHELRTIELERARGTYGRVVSVGASGRWYFDWFERSVGTVDEHVGVEAFEPEPSDLPQYVRWVPTTADRFEGLADREVDLVFAGQTSEHLWADELTGFLLQSRRVLRDDGVLVLDSPNRLVTEHLQWSHGGHTVELSPAEIAELVALAGFEVESVRGVWRCRFGDAVLQLEEQLDHGPSLVRRITDGPDRPDDCFVWWLVGRPVADPDPVALEKHVHELYARHWPTRVCRGMWPGPTHPGPRAEPGGVVVAESLAFMLHGGRWRVGIDLDEGSTESIRAASIEITLPGRHRVHLLELSSAKVEPARICWEFEQTKLMLALSIALHVEVTGAPVRVAMPLLFELVRD